MTPFVVPHGSIEQEMEHLLNTKLTSLAEERLKIKESVRVHCPPSATLARLGNELLTARISTPHPRLPLPVRQSDGPASRDGQALPRAGRSGAHLEAKGARPQGATPGKASRPGAGQGSAKDQRARVQGRGVCAAATTTLVCVTKVCSINLVTCGLCWWWWW